MANYFIKSDKVNKKYIVIENSYQLPIKSFSTYNEARKLAGHLNNGGGFAGHTPPFVLKSVAHEQT